MQGLKPIYEPKKKNAFLYPNDPDAVIPQYEKQQLIDYRSSAIENSGFEYRGGQRKTRRLAEQEEAKGDDEGWDEEEVVDQDEALDIDDIDMSKLGLGGMTKKIKKQIMADSLVEGRFHDGLLNLLQRVFKISMN